MKVIRVDPRNIGSEDDTPTFRVTAWTELGGGGYQAEEFELTDTDVHGALAFVEERAAEGAHEVELFVVVSTAGKWLHTARLAGRNPTDSP
jgi:hypothetical protein